MGSSMSSPRISGRFSIWRWWSTSGFGGAHYFQTKPDMRKSFTSASQSIDNMCMKLGEFPPSHVTFPKGIIALKPYKASEGHEQLMINCWIPRHEAHKTPYPLVNVYITIENHHLLGKSTMASFNSTKRWPEGFQWGICISCDKFISTSPSSVGYLLTRGIPSWWKLFATKCPATWRRRPFRCWRPPSWASKQRSATCAMAKPGLPKKPGDLAWFSMI